MDSKTININKVIYITFSTLFIATILSILALANIRVSADAQSASASVNVSAACSMSATDTTHTATLAPGTFTGDIGLTNVTATCNDPLGYAIYAIGYSNNTYGNTSLIGPNDNIINTGTSTSGDTSNWSMKLGTGTGDSASIVTTPINYTTYAPVPETYTKVATYANDTTTEQAGTSFTTTYGVYTSPSQPAGTYTGAVRYTLVHPHNAIPQDKYYMQDFTTSMCEVLAHDDNFTVYDKRDDNDYTVRYLDGQCIMTQNLRYVGGNHGVAEEGVAVNSAGVTFEMEDSMAQSYTEPYYHNSGRTDYGVYYNYCAASGGTICADGHQGTLEDATVAVCPAGWGLPKSLHSTASWGGISMDSILDNGNFDIFAGYYGDEGELINSSISSLFWSSNASYQTYTRYDLKRTIYGESSVDDTTMRKRLLSVRCILSN